MNTAYNVNLIKADKFETIAQKQGSLKPQDIDRIVFNIPIEEVSMLLIPPMCTQDLL